MCLLFYLIGFLIGFLIAKESYEKTIRKQQIEITNLSLEKIYNNLKGEKNES